MSVLVKGMEMPSSCADCNAYVNNGNSCWCVLSVREIDDDTRVDLDCPLVEVKTPHGDLVDKQKLLKAWSDLEDVSDKIKDPHDVEVALAEQTCDILFDAPTVIEAEERA